LKAPLRSLEITYLVHATEDPEKLEGAVGSLLSGGAPSQTEEMEGHYGNAIGRVRVHITGEEAQEAFRRMVSALGREQKDEILGSLASHMDEHSALFIRFDKQALASGKLSLGPSDPVRVKVKPAPFLLGRDAAGFYARLFAEE
jgi:RNA binding exosome subunit